MFGCGKPMLGPHNETVNGTVEHLLAATAKLFFEDKQNVSYVNQKSIKKMLTITPTKFFDKVLYKTER